MSKMETKTTLAERLRNLSVGLTKKMKGIVVEDLGDEHAYAGYGPPEKILPGKYKVFTSRSGKPIQYHLGTDRSYMNMNPPEIIEYDARIELEEDYNTADVYLFRDGKFTGIRAILSLKDSSANRFSLDNIVPESRIEASASRAVNEAASLLKVLGHHVGRTLIKGDVKGGNE